MPKPLRPRSDTRTHTLSIVPLPRDEVPALCERVRHLVRAGGAEIIVCDVSRLAPDLVTVQALVRLQLTARGLGASLRLQHASRRLTSALEICGVGGFFAIGSERQLHLTESRGSSVSVHSTAEQVQSLASSTDESSLVMLNLLRFKPQADGIDVGVSGAQAYARYRQAAEPFLLAVGGRLLAALAPRESVIGPSESEWDLVLLVEYPSRARFIEMTSDPAYLKIHAHREAALADSRLIACSQLSEALLGWLLQTDS